MTVIISLIALWLGWFGHQMKVKRIISNKYNEYYRMGNTPQRVWCCSSLYEEITGKRPELKDL